MIASVDKCEALVVGAGPAGLMAAETLAEGGVQVCVAEAMPSPARKFLMAGKSGLNLTKAEPIDDFLARFSDVSPDLEKAVRAFGPDEVMAWSEALGQEVFTGSTGRVFPRAMKASPLLRAWLARLGANGVQINRRWRWTGWSDEGLLFQTPEGQRCIQAKVVILALGGASWRRLGSDGAWADLLATRGIELAPFKPSNVALSMRWSDHMTRHFGAPIKNVRLSAGDVESRGECVVTRAGMEGGGVYEISMAVRDGAPLFLDLVPDLSLEEVTARVSKPRGKTSLSNHLRKTVGLGSVQRALLMEWERPLPEGAVLARRIKALQVPHDGPVQMDKAISTGGGVAFKTLHGFRLRDLPHVYVAGEMLDWEAPTGGYLLTACLATGRAAGRQALAQLRR